VKGEKTPRKRKEKENRSAEFSKGFLSPKLTVSKKGRKGEKRWGGKED